jgi:hypothetical protein
MSESLRCWHCRKKLATRKEPPWVYFRLLTLPTGDEVRVHLICWPDARRSISKVTARVTQHP